MVYEVFLTTIKESLHAQLGDDYNILMQKVPKNNGTLLDGLSISKHSDRVAPTLYLNAYYEQMEAGTSLEDILTEILSIFSDASVTPFIDPDILSNFDQLRNKVVYKLIHTDSNETLLNDIPHMPYLDLSLVFYLILEESEYGHMTALVHQDHMNAWRTSLEELYELAMKNTPLLLTAEIKSMDDVMQDFVKAQLGQDYRDEFMNDLLLAKDASPLYVLSNTAGLNGACTILYEGLLKNFADTLAQDLIILPSSIHEVLLIPHTDNINFPELSEMVHYINRTEVPDEDRLSDQIYYYDRGRDQVSLIPVSAEQSAS